MGEVYRARDTKLNRDVALKVLPDSFANDPDRLARFEREAQVLASLNHPNIAHIHGLEDSGGVRALVMELVEGEDLAQRLTRGAIPIDEVTYREALAQQRQGDLLHRGRPAPDGPSTSPLAPLSSGCRRLSSRRTSLRSGRSRGNSTSWRWTDSGF